MNHPGPYCTLKCYNVIDINHTYTCLFSPYSCRHHDDRKDYYIESLSPGNKLAWKPIIPIYKFNIYYLRISLASPKSASFTTMSLRFDVNRQFLAAISLQIMIKTKHWWLIILLLLFASTWVHPRFLRYVLLIFWVFILFYIAYLHSWVPCILQDYHMKTMLGSSLPPVVWRMTDVLFMLFVSVSLLVVSNSYWVVFLLCLSSTCVPDVASFFLLSLSSVYYPGHLWSKLLFQSRSGHVFLSKVSISTHFLLDFKNASTVEYCCCFSFYSFWQEVKTHIIMQTNVCWKNI